MLNVSWFFFVLSCTDHNQEQHTVGLLASASTCSIAPLNEHVGLYHQAFSKSEVFVLAATAPV